jgi:hypothetical protein
MAVTISTFLFGKCGFRYFYKRTAAIKLSRAGYMMQPGTTDLLG